MEHYRYIIVGGGMSGSAAQQGIREVDPDGSIAIFSQEPDLPYNRPPLTKALWKGKPVASIFRKVDEPGTKVLLGNTITGIDRTSKQVTGADEKIYTYDKLLLAPGGTPRRLPFGEGHILYYRTLQDYYALRQSVEINDHLVVIGGGFIGSEITAALTMNNKRVTMLFPEEGIGWNVFPPDLSAYVTEYFRNKGVEIMAGEQVTDVRREGNRTIVVTQSNKEIETTGVVIAGIGIQPNDSLAAQAGLDTDKGILVNANLQTSDPDIYAAGDVARFYNPALRGSLRVEHEDNANRMGVLAGRNMAGKEEAYTHLPMFYSDLFDLGYEAVGLTMPSLEVIADWVEPNQKGVVYYLKDGLVRGVLLWNVWDRVDAARELIARSEPVDPGELKGLLTGPARTRETG